MVDLKKLARDARAKADKHVVAMEEGLFAGGTGEALERITHVEHTIEIDHHPIRIRFARYRMRSGKDVYHLIIGTPDAEVNLVPQRIVDMIRDAFFPEGSDSQGLPMRHTIQFLQFVQ